MHIVLDRVDGGSGAGTVLVRRTTDAGEPDGEPMRTTLASLPSVVAELEGPGVRWVWDDTNRWYPPVLAAGGRVARCFDLRLNHRILRTALAAARSALATAPDGPWDETAAPAAAPRPDALFDESLFDDPVPSGAAPDDRTGGTADDRALVEFRSQLDAVAGSDDPGALRLLLAAESAGALIAAEMRFAGLPWRADVHEALLEDALGPRVPYGVRPRRLEALVGVLRTELDDPQLNPDSPTDVLRSLRRAGLVVESTRKWELAELQHPAIEPLLEYKRLYRLLTANGWTWLDEWIADGRFHPDYVVGGVVSGRWATSGGGALQLPKQIRSAVIADPGWKLVVADAAQLEPRVLAALSGDLRMAEAGRGRDLYDGIVASGAVETRQQAKGAMLGAMYGATQGEGGRLVPRLARQYPRALALVESAARMGERGELVRSRLGRTSPSPGRDWLDAQALAHSADGSPALERAARSRGRSWGRFTRNFVVQASASEWALSWMAGLRTRLAARFPGPVTDSAHLVFFLHDEIMVHTPEADADWVVSQVEAAAADAGRLLFGSFPVDFPLSVAVVDDYGSAK
ncbi:bifunctional 3'-5' exonuclease/DNA polymerase [Curtobacterium sp. RRHDQ10]|uniref:bifunctional 3'-5' exonuclease/DNA polymerase n=1 Tax=Curtobacterium phyllosphaerae TaxID=3413379 RepID=UPI003BF05D06